MTSGPNDYNPDDFGFEGSGSHSVSEDWKVSGYDHHTVHDSDGNTFSWNEVEYYDSNGNYHRDVVNPHANDSSQW